MQKFVIWLCIVATVVLVLYVIWTGIPEGVHRPFTPPPHP